MKTYATFWQRLLAMLIDLLVFAPLIVLYQFIEPVSKVAAAVVTILHASLGQAYVIYGHGRFGRTVGKWVMRIRVLRVTGEPLRWREAWLRSAFDVCFMVAGTSGMVAALLGVADSQYYGVGWRARSANLEAHQPAWAVLATAVGMVWFYSEVVTMLFNKQRRALHDFVAGSVVVSEPRRGAAIMPMKLPIRPQGNWSNIESTTPRPARSLSASRSTDETMPISKRTLMWWEIVGAVISGCCGIYFLFFAEVKSGPGAVVFKILFGGIPFVGAHILALGAACLRLQGRAAWIGQYLIAAFGLVVVLFLLVL